MTHKKVFWAVFVLIYIFSAGIFYILGSRMQTNTPDVVFPQRPLGEGGFLVIAVVMNNISNSLNRQIRDGNLDIPPIQLQHVGASYKTSHSWIAVSDDLVVAYMYQDVVIMLTKDELMATILHDVCHVKLEHLETRVLKQEVEADLCAYGYRAKPEALISAMSKLTLDKYETAERIKALEQLS